MTKKRSTEDYEVGYRKPPVANQFTQGQPSPNPKGRPKGSKNVTSLSKLLEKKVQVGVKNGRRITRSVREVLDQNLIKQAIDGDHRARALLYSLIDHESAAAAKGLLSPAYQLELAAQEAEKAGHTAKIIQLIITNLDTVAQWKKMGIVIANNGIVTLPEWAVEARAKYEASIVR